MVTFFGHLFNVILDIDLTQCGQKFEKYDDLIAHARHVHYHPIVKCHDCGKEFIHEKDRLHHVKEEHEKKVDRRTHKWEHVHDKK